jgi:hypothetical protein
VEGNVVIEAVPCSHRMLPLTRRSEESVLCLVSS